VPRWEPAASWSLSVHDLLNLQLHHAEGISAWLSSLLCHWTRCAMMRPHVVVTHGIMAEHPRNELSLN